MRLEHLIPFLAENAEELQADLALVCDTGMWDAETPAITTLLRGLLYEEVRDPRADRDLHSGLFGGAARNPIHVLARDPRRPARRATAASRVPGFYDGVHELPADIKADLEALNLTTGRLSRDRSGFRVPAGEKGRCVLEQIWARPTCEVNGIVGGYTGEGAKTVIPAEASAKMSFRLVGEQDPEKIREAFRAFVRERAAGRLQGRPSPTMAAPGDQLAVRQPGAAEGARGARRGMGHARR